MNHSADRYSMSPEPRRAERIFLQMLRRVLLVGIVLVAMTALARPAKSVSPTVIPADASVSWLHSTRANAADRAKGWHPCEHDCHNTSCDKICHYR